MFIRANHFEYDKLLEGIIELGDFKDEVIDDESILKVMLNFQEAYKAQIKKDTLKPWQRKICAQFFSSVGGAINYGFASEDDVTLVEKVASFDTSVKECLEKLEAVLDGSDDGYLWGPLEFFVEYVNDHAVLVTEDPPSWDYVFSGQRIKGGDFVNHLAEWLGIYNGAQLEGLNHFLYKAINLNLLPHELVRDITVLDLPGDKVKHGNVLITFPIIMLEVFDL
ncbi:putative RNA polymerase sigma factor [Kosakonia phage Kc263]|uniref:RNA polymerase sigma factor n=1 Tax=Kosakonia phage Kc263 TaxID=2863194 RepID=A0AAE7WFU4_9CAUD|nr:putative RNA polymerase sigma factor [Kosakonia phage Kc263]QYN80035.1 putative RNA polymerase sigma factor [Kosakonia phage Kc263]